MNKLDLRRIRKDFGLTQRGLSQLTGYPQSYLSYVERGRADASKTFRERLTAALKIKDLDKYIIKEEPPQQTVQQPPQQPEADLSIVTINKLLNMIEDRDRRIKELEDEIKALMVPAQNARTAKNSKKR